MVDKLFEMEVRYFENTVTFVQKIRFTKPQYDIDCYVEYGACNDQSCLPPSEAVFKAKGASPVAVGAKPEEAKPEEAKSPEENKDSGDALQDSVAHSPTLPDSLEQKDSLATPDSLIPWSKKTL